MDDVTIDGAEEELAFTNILIDTLDPYADGYRTQLADLEAKRAHYQQLTDTMRHNVPSGDHAAPDGPNAPASRDQWWQAAMDGRLDSTLSNSGPSSGWSSANPHGTPVNGSKRPRPQSSYLDAAAQYPYKRQTPQPSKAGTPTSSDGSNDMEDHTAQLLERTRDRQLAAETLIRRHHEMQQADSKLARELSNQTFTQPFNFASSSFSRPSVQTTLKPNGSCQRPSSNLKIEASSSSSRSSNSAQPSSHSSHGQPMKSEPALAHRQGPPQRTQQAPQFVDLTASDSEDDLEEVGPASFTPSQRQPVTANHDTFQRTPLHTPAPTWMPLPTTMPMPGAYPSTDRAAQSYVHSNDFMHNQNNTASKPWFSDLTNGIANGLAGPLRQLNEFVSGSSFSRPFDIDTDDDDDDVIYDGSRQRPAHRYGNYADNEDLYRSRYDAFAAHDSTKTKEEIQALLANIRPDEELPAHLRVQTPEALSVKLHKYQELGLTWLKKCEEGSNMGGILADDMGLGKTIQMISLMVTRKSEEPRCKTTLIIAPVALMRQWAQEIKSKLKPGRHQLTIFTHHGTRKAKSFHDLQGYDVVLTTYGSIASELKKLERFRMRQHVNPDATPHPKEKCVFLDPDAHWYRVILDEAQCIKNRKTQTAKGTSRIRAKYRFCVTGTPMMNNVEEFYSLIQFLRIKPYCRWEKFRLDINTPLKTGTDDTKARGMRLLQALCKAVMLRRTKSSYFEGQPILVLPERSTVVDNPVFNNDEQDFYKALESRSQLEFNKYLRRGTIGKSYSAILVLLLRLRQACCHPHLIRDFSVAATADLREEQMLEFAKQLADPVISRIKETGGNFECPVCYDVTSNPAIFIPCGHDTCPECFSRIADPANAIQNGDEGGGIKCPNCRGPVDPKRLTDFISFKKAHMPEMLASEERNEPVADEIDEDDESGSESSDDSDRESEEEDDGTEDESLKNFVVGDDEVEYDEDTKDDFDENDGVKREHNWEEEGTAGPSSAATHVEDVKEESGKKFKGRGKRKKKKGKKGKGKEKVMKAKTAVTLAELKKLATRNKKAKKAYLHRLRKSWISSAKIDKTMEILQEIINGDNGEDGEKVLIFSQWTSLLDLLEVPIDDAGYGYRRYDGSMTATMRGDAVDDFRDETKDVRIMLISLKAGNAGLNLNMANQVIILDPFWNPYIEEQAIDRAHRFGQMRPVRVHRLLIQETVEDRILALQEKKRALISEALDENQANALSRLGVQELAYLFGVTHDPSQRVNYVPQNRR